MNLDVIYCGDCVEVMKRMVTNDSISLTVTSPPYDSMRSYRGYTFDFPSVAEQLYRVTKPGGVVVWVVGDETIDGSETGTSFRQALGFMDKGFLLHDTMIFHKTGVNYPSTNRYTQVFEYMFVLSKGKPSVFNPIEDIAKKWEGSWGKTKVRQKDGSLITYERLNEGKASSGKAEGDEYGYRMRDNVWVLRTGKRFGHADEIAYGHPATFPEDLAEGHILTWTNPGDVVLDPMCGSGTSLKMAKATGRRYIGIDVSDEYCEMARKRVELVNKV